MTVNWDYIRQLYLHQTGEKKSHKEICRAVLKEIDDFLEGNTKRVFRLSCQTGRLRSPSRHLCGILCKSDARRSEERDNIQTTEIYETTHIKEIR